MTEVFNCGFTRVAVRNLKESSRKCTKESGESATRFKIRCLDFQIDKFTKQFDGISNFAVPRVAFNVKAPKIVDLFRRWPPRKIKERDTYLQTFSEDNWNSLPLSKKKRPHG